MSNNKQIMKLYTEEQIIKVFEKYGNMSAINARNILDLSESIELPSDEEIGKLRDEHIPIDEENMWSERFYFTIGAKWMRDKIQGGNNEQ